jgi:hypothetical protein
MVNVISFVDLTRNWTEIIDNWFANILKVISLIERKGESRGKSSDEGKGITHSAKATNIREDGKIHITSIVNPAFIVLAMP